MVYVSGGRVASSALMTLDQLFVPTQYAWFLRSTPGFKTEKRRNRLYTHLNPLSFDYGWYPVVLTVIKGNSYLQGLNELGVEEPGEQVNALGCVQVGQGVSFGLPLEGLGTGK